MLERKKSAVLTSLFLLSTHLSKKAAISVI